MAIYKLGTAVNEIIVGRDMPLSKKSSKNSFFKFPIVSNGVGDSQVQGFTDNKLTQKPCITISARGTIGFVSFWSEPIFPTVRLLAIVPNEKLCYPKYLYYILLKTKFQSTGAVQKQLTKPMLEEVQLNLPPLVEQQKIINIIEQKESLFLAHSNCVKIDSIKDVEKDMKVLIDFIEPVEEVEEKTNYMLKTVEDLAKHLIHNDLINTKSELMKVNCIFEKGKNTKNFATGKTSFLNVAAANANYNKKCDEDPNIFPGDVTLSLDGNVGLVNNFLNGFNGYLYKIFSTKHPNWAIYFSLKTDANKALMKQNETGTAIKHSNNSKNVLRFYYFKYNKALETLYNFEILLKAQLQKIASLKKELLKLLIH